MIGNSGEVAADIGIPSSTNGLITFTSNAELDRIADERANSLKPPVPVINIGGLASHVRNFFASAKDAKQDIETKLFAILRQVKGDYDPQQLAAIRSFGGSEDFIRLTQQKVRDAESWILDIIDPNGDRTWEIEPTPIVDLPKSLIEFMRGKIRERLMQESIAAAQEQGTEFSSEQVQATMAIVEKKVIDLVKKKAMALAQKKAVNMRTKILDQMEEGGWNAAFRACINDLTKSKACIMKGPVYKRVPRTKWEENNDGKFNAKATFDIIPTFSRVNPFDWYPAPKSTHVNKGDAIELEHLAPIDLERMFGVPGYRKDAIKRIISDYPMGFIEDTYGVQSERDDVEHDDADSTNRGITYDMLNFWGTVSGKILLDNDVTIKGVSIVPGKFYHVNIKTINDIIIKDPVLNPDPSGSKPYDVT
jgi:hypothetical protein